MPRSLTYDDAVRLLKRPGTTLVKTFVATKRGREFSIVSKSGGPSGSITEATALRLMAHPKCRPSDPGLLVGASNPFHFTRPQNRTRNPRQRAAREAMPPDQDHL